jgi:hypothetical protein
VPYEQVLPSTCERGQPLGLTRSHMARQNVLVLDSSDDSHSEPVLSPSNATGNVALAGPTDQDTSRQVFAQSWPAAYPPLGVPVPRKKRIGLIIGACAAALVIVAGAAVGSVALANREHLPKAQAAPAPVVSTSNLPVPEWTPGPLHQGDLRSFLIDAPSSSAKVVPPFGTDNSFNLKQASNDWGNPKWRTSMLSLYEFQVGAIRQWKDPDLYVGDEIYRFATASRALDFYNADNAITNYFNPADCVNGRRHHRSCRHLLLDQSQQPW